MHSIVRLGANTSPKSIELTPYIECWEQAGSGVKMHDVVRDFSRSLQSAEEMRWQQRKMVQLVLDATPSDGWLHASHDTEPLAVYTRQSLRQHMVEALMDDVLHDPVVHTWLTFKPSPMIDYVVGQASCAIGGLVLLRLAADAETMGDFRSASLYLSGALRSDEFSTNRADNNTEGIALCFRTAESYSQILDPAISDMMNELAVRTRMFLMVDFMDPRSKPNMERYSMVFKECRPHLKKLEDPQEQASLRSCYSLSGNCLICWWHAV